MAWLPGSFLLSDGASGMGSDGGGGGQGGVAAIDGGHYLVGQGGESLANRAVESSTEG